MSDPIEYRLKDFLEEINTVIWEKRVALEKAVSKHNDPVAGLTQLRIDRLNAIAAYLVKIDVYQKSKMEAAGAEREEERDEEETDAVMIKRIVDVATELRRMGKPATAEALRTFVPSEGHHLIEQALAPKVDEKPAASVESLPLEPESKQEQSVAVDEIVDDWD